MGGAIVAYGETGVNRPITTSSNLVAGLLFLAAVPCPAQAQTGGAAMASPDSNAMVLAQRWSLLQVVPPAIENRVIVNAPLDKAWALWTDPIRLPEFMGFGATIEARPGGAYQVVFVPDAPDALSRGNDGRIIAIEPRSMLSFTWMTPMHMAALHGNSTVVTLYFTPLEGGARTQVDLVNTGYGTGDDWRAAYEYNVGGWDRVLAHFQYAAEVGPIDWTQRARDLKRDGTLPMWREFKRKQLRGEDPYAKGQ